MGIAHLEAPAGRRDDFVDPYFKQAKSDKVVAILKAREPARIMIAIGTEDRWHLQFAQPWIVQYNFYNNDRRWGRIFVRICPYLPFSARVCQVTKHYKGKLQTVIEDLELPNPVIRSHYGNGFIKLRITV